jgi:hypothetical protein
MNGNDLWEALGEISKEIVQIPMNRNGFRYFQQRLVPTDPVICGRLGDLIHRAQLYLDDVSRGRGG